MIVEPIVHPVYHQVNIINNGDFETDRLPYKVYLKDVEQVSGWNINHGVLSLIQNKYRIWKSQILSLYSRTEIKY